VDIHGILEFLDWFPTVKERDLRVVCYGCGDGRHIPFLVSFFPGVQWEIYTPENKPLQIKHALKTSPFPSIQMQDTFNSISTI
jgi:hypothetical protein